MSRFILVIIPLVTCSLVLVAIFVVGSPGAQPAARLYGGPTTRVADWAWTVVVDRVLGPVEAVQPDGPVVLEVTLPNGRRHSVSRVTKRGRVDVSLRVDEPLDGPVAVVVRAIDGALLARGPVHLDQKTWLREARRAGGWVKGRPSGALRVDVAPVRGALAVDFAETILIRVQRGSSPLAGARVELVVEGASLSHAETAPAGRASAPNDPQGPARAPAARLDVTTDLEGSARVEVRPHEFAVALAVSASDSEGLKGRWYGTLPVVAGALHATRRGRKVTVTSPIPRPLAYASIVTEQARLLSAELDLLPAPRGRAKSELELPESVAELPELWAVVSGEPHMDAAGAVGWPIPPTSVIERGLSQTLTVKDQLLLDGRPLVRLRQESQRRRARWLAGFFCVLAVVVLAILTLSKTRSAERALVGHLRGAGQGDLDVARIAGTHHWLWVAVLAVFLMALGYAVVALVAIARLN